MNDVIRNLYKVLKDNLSLYVYKGNFIDISIEFDISPVVDITNVATTFGITGLDSSQTLDNLKNRYLKFNDKYRKITDYIPLTNTITIASTFGEVILTTDVVKVIVLDSLFIDSLDTYPLTSQLNNKDTRVMFDCSLKTRFDWDKSNYNTYFQEIKDLFYTTYRLNIPLYNSTYTTITGNLNLDSKIEANDISFLAKQNSSVGYIEYNIRFNGKYSQKY